MRDVIVQGGESVGVEVADGLAARLVKYLELLMKWNQRINLVAPGSPRVLAVRHIVDSLALVPFIPEGASRGVDVGSGGGFPGAIVAMCTPHLEVTALEPVRKKAAFLAAVRREFGLSNFVPATDRVENHPSTYDVAMSRAAFAIPTWLEHGRRLAPTGTVLAMEGAEQYPLPPGATRHPYPLEGRSRAVIVYRST